MGQVQNLESLIVRVVGMESEFDLGLHMPSVAAWTQCLSEATQLVYLTLIGVSFENGDDLDWNGLRETLRIHPSLQSAIIKDCRFSSSEKLDMLVNALATSVTPHSKQRHSEFIESIIVESVEDPIGPATWYQSIVAWCVLPVAACL